MTHLHGQPAAPPARTLLQEATCAVSKKGEEEHGPGHGGHTQASAASHPQPACCTPSLLMCPLMLRVGGLHANLCLLWAVTDLCLTSSWAPVENKILSRRLCFQDICLIWIFSSCWLDWPVCGYFPWSVDTGVRVSLRVCRWHCGKPNLPTFTLQ